MLAPELKCEGNWPSLCSPQSLDAKDIGETLHLGRAVLAIELKCEAREERPVLPQVWINALVVIPAWSVRAAGPGQTKAFEGLDPV